MNVNRRFILGLLAAGASCSSPTVAPIDNLGPYSVAFVAFFDGDSRVLALTEVFRQEELEAGLPVFDAPDGAERFALVLLGPEDLPEGLDLDAPLEVVLEVPPEAPERVGDPAARVGSTRMALPASVRVWVSLLDGTEQASGDWVRSSLEALGLLRNVTLVASVDSEACRPPGLGDLESFLPPSSGLPNEYPRVAEVVDMRWAGNRLIVLTRGGLYLLQQGSRRALDVVRPRDGRFSGFSARRSRQGGEIDIAISEEHWTVQGLEVDPRGFGRLHFLRLVDDAFVDRAVSSTTATPLASVALAPDGRYLAGAYKIPEQFVLPTYEGVFFGEPEPSIELPGLELETLRSDSDAVFRIIASEDRRRDWVAGTRQRVYELNDRGGWTSSPLRPDELLTENRPIFAMTEFVRSGTSEYWVGGVRGTVWRRAVDSEDWTLGWEPLHDRLSYPPRFSICADRFDQETGRLVFEVGPIRHVDLTNEYAFLAYGVCPAAVIVRLADEVDDLCVSMAFAPDGLNERLGYNAVAVDAGRLALAGPTGIYVGAFSVP